MGVGVTVASFFVFITQNQVSKSIVSVMKTSQLSRIVVPGLSIERVVTTENTQSVSCKFTHFKFSFKEDKKQPAPFPCLLD